MHSLDVIKQYSSTIGRQDGSPIVLFDESEVDALFQTFPFSIPFVDVADSNGWKLSSIWTVSPHELSIARQAIKNMVNGDQTYAFGIVKVDEKCLDLGVFYARQKTAPSLMLSLEEFLDGEDPSKPFTQS